MVWRRLLPGHGRPLFSDARLDNQRGVILRTSFVVGRNQGAGSGALGRLGWLARMGLGGKVGHGQQGMSWIHELDMNRIFYRALTHDSMHGAYIASSPEPVPQVEFMRLLRRTLKVPIGLPATEWMVRVGAHWLLKTDPELALYGRFVLPKRLQDEGFTFQFPELNEALKQIYSA